ncbi:putative nuclease HARBI1 [Girardinichthys multiradiatus]|uniref:putative nuclease HARBI1 n=1 Tax=Girardinichthys multiradiatus TaxID=208333 RepID=UPI001FAC3BB8|nr:putative nuclease HARBI1 [Girardinichthys multiradiatus]
MPSSLLRLSVVCALAVFLRLSAAKRRHERRRRRLRQLLLLVDQFMTVHPASYCRLNHRVPILRLWFDVESELKQDFHLSRRAMHALQRLLQKDQDHGWGNELEVLIYIYWLAHGLSYRVVSGVFNVPRSTVHRIIHKVAQRIWLHLSLAISFPRTEDLHQVGRGFVDQSGSTVFNEVVGVIDSTHIRIKAPQRHQCDYLNEKGFYSITMQAIFDSNGRFLDIFVGYPGSVPDAGIMRNSSFYQARRYPPTSYILLGDESYPCLDSPIRLITPYTEPVNGQLQELFNYHHYKARRVAERAFGAMRTRWRATLSNTMEVKPAFASQVVSSCAFLHNVCLDNGDVLEQDDETAHDALDFLLPPQELLTDEKSGIPTRDRLAAKNMSVLQE